MFQLSGNLQAIPAANSCSTRGNARGQHHRWDSLPRGRATRGAIAYKRRKEPVQDAGEQGSINDGQDSDQPPTPGVNDQQQHGHDNRLRMLAPPPNPNEPEDDWD